MRPPPSCFEVVVGLGAERGREGRPAVAATSSSQPALLLRRLPPRLLEHKKYYYPRPSSSSACLDCYCRRRQQATPAIDASSFAFFLSEAAA